MIGVNAYIIVALILFCIGVTGILVRRNSMVILMSIELMLNAVNILLVIFSRTTPKMQLNENALLLFRNEYLILIGLVVIVAIMEAVVGLFIIMLLFRTTRSVDINFLNRLKH